MNSQVKQMSDPSAPKPGCDIGLLPQIGSSKWNGNALWGGIGIAGLATGAIVLLTQAAALPLLSLFTDGNAWALAASFGAGSAISLRLLAGSARSRTVGDFALHDALTVALVLLAAAATGPMTAALLLPGAVLLACLSQRILKNRSSDIVETTLPLLVLIALVGLWQSSGEQGWIVSGGALVLASLLRIGRKALPALLAPAWRFWLASAAISAAVAAFDFDMGAVMPSLDASLIAVAAGLIYGSGYMLGARRLGRAAAQTISVAVPFVSVGVLMAFKGLEHPALLASITLLVGAFIAANRRRIASAEQQNFDASESRHHELGWSNML